jgi:hypothetical protein
MFLDQRRVFTDFVDVEDGPLADLDHVAQILGRDVLVTVEFDFRNRGTLTHAVEQFHTRIRTLTAHFDFVEVSHRVDRLHVATYIFEIERYTLFGGELLEDRIDFDTALTQDLDLRHVFAGVILQLFQEIVRERRKCERRAKKEGC